MTLPPSGVRSSSLEFIAHYPKTRGGNKGFKCSYIIMKGSIVRIDRRITAKCLLPLCFNLQGIFMLLKMIFKITND